jgi:RyR domain
MESQLSRKDRILLGFLGCLPRAPGPRGGVTGAVLIAAAGFLLGLWGWVEAVPSPPRGDERFYWERQFETTARLMAGGELGADVFPRWQFQWVPWTLPLLAFWAAALLFLRYFPNGLLVWLTTRLSSFDCIYGAGPLALQLSRDHRTRGVGVLAIAPDEDGEVKFRRDRVPVIRTDGSDRLEESVAERVVIAADERDLTNAVLSQELFRATAKRPQRILARINNLPLRTHLSEHYSAGQPTLATRLVLFSTVDLQARYCLRAHPLDRFKFAAHPHFAHALVLGFEEMGEAMTLTLLKSSHFTHGQAVRVTVVDRDPQARKSEFQSRFPEAFSCHPLEFEPDDRADRGVPHEVLKRLLDEGKGPTAVFVCLPQPSGGVAASLGLLKQYRLLGAHLPPIHILAAAASPGFEESLRALQSLDDGGMLSMTRAEIEIVDGELLLQERLDRLAECIHEKYLEDRLSEGKEIGDQPSYHHWPQLPESFKEDNREQADHHWLKLRDIGCAVTSGEPTPFNLTLKEVEALAMSEHHRWLAARKIRGWKFGRPRDDVKKVHPEIVPWKDLEEGQREISRVTVRRIPEYLALIGNGVQRPVLVRVVASGGARPPRQALESYRRRIQENYPGRRLVVASDLTTEAEREICGFFLDGAADFVLLLPKPIYEIVAALDPAARASYTRLARGASRILAGVEGRDPDPLPLLAAYQESENRALVVGESIPVLSRADRMADDGVLRWADEA